MNKIKRDALKARTHSFAFKVKTKNEETKMNSSSWNLSMLEQFERELTSLEIMSLAVAFLTTMIVSLIYITCIDQQMMVDEVELTEINIEPNGHMDSVPV